MKEKLENWSGVDVNLNLRPHDKPAYSLFEPDSQLAVTLPPRMRAAAHVEAELGLYPLISIVHGPKFEVSFKNLYSPETSEYAKEESRFLPLLHAVIALGCLFAQIDPETPSLEDIAAEGLIS